MKKKIEDELFRLAEKIVNSKDSLDVVQLKAEARNLYEKLCVLHFTERHLAETEFEEPEAETKVVSEEPTKKFLEEQKEATDDDDNSTYFAPDGTEYNDSEAITEPNTEKIKNIVAEMPQETNQIDDLFARVNTEEKTLRQPEAPRERVEKKPEPKKPQPEPTRQPESRSEPEPKAEPQPQSNRTDFHDFGIGYDNLPKFEPINQNGKASRPKSLNDRLKKGITIGLNERLAFIKHLFEGNSTDYNRVLSQLNTFHTLEEAHKFIQLVVKPDYNNWEGKEQYEQQFLEKVENKFEN